MPRVRVPEPAKRAFGARVPLADFVAKYLELVGRLDAGRFEPGIARRTATWSGYSVQEIDPPEPARAASLRRRAMIELAWSCGGAGLLGRDFVVDFVHAEASPELCNKLASGLWDDLHDVFIEDDGAGHCLTPIATMFDPHIRWKYVVDYITGDMSWYGDREGEQGYQSTHASTRADDYIEAQELDFDYNEAQLTALKRIREVGPQALHLETIEELKLEDHNVKDFVIIHEMERTAGALSTQGLQRAQYVLADPENENTGWIPMLFVGDGRLGFMSEYREL